MTVHFQRKEELFKILLEKVSWEEVFKHKEHKGSVQIKVFAVIVNEKLRWKIHTDLV